jgi:signal transduction histidine kinase
MGTAVTDMRGPPHWSASIAFRLPAAIGFIALIVTVFAFAAIIALGRARSEMEAHGARSFNSLAAAARLSREAGELLVSAPFLINTTSALRITSESRAIIARIDMLATEVAGQATDNSTAQEETRLLLDALLALKRSTLAVAAEAEAASIERDRVATDVLSLASVNRAGGQSAFLATGINQIVLNAAAAENLIQLGELRRDYLIRMARIQNVTEAGGLHERLFAGRQAYLIHVHAMRHALSRLEGDLVRLTSAIDGRTQAMSAALSSAVAASSAEIRRLQSLMGVALLAVIGLCAGTVFYVIRRVSRPLGTIAAAMAHVPDTDVPGADAPLLAIRHADALELRQLLDAFISFKASLAERNREQARAQRLDALMGMTSQLNHEIGNMIGVISGTAALIERDGLDARQAKRLARISKAAERGRTLLSGMLAFASHQVLKPERVDAARIIRGTADILELAAGHAIRIRIDADQAAHVFVDAAMLEQAILNLVLNARDAMPEGGSVALSVAVADDSVSISVTDTGTGMTPEVRDRALEPYFTTRSGKGGTGLGLAIVYGFVRQSSGTVAIESQPGRGTVVTLSFPAA